MHVIVDNIRIGISSHSAPSASNISDFFQRERVEIKDGNQSRIGSGHVVRINPTNLLVSTDADIIEAIWK